MVAGIATKLIHTAVGVKLVKTDKSTLRVTLCETDPVLLKSMLLFLQKEPAIKAPTSPRYAPKLRAATAKAVRRVAKIAAAATTGRYKKMKGLMAPPVRCTTIVTARTSAADCR